jgi:hypothetical protein
MAHEARVVVQETDEQRSLPAALGAQHLLRAVVEVGVPETVCVRDLVAAHLEIASAARFIVRLAAVARPHSSLALEAGGLHEAAHRVVGGHGAELSGPGDAGEEIVVVELDRPAGVLVVLLAHELAQIESEARLRAQIATHGTSESGHRVAAGARGVEPTLDGRAAEAHGLPRARVTPGFLGQPGDLFPEIAAPRRGSEQRAHDREAQPCPSVSRAVPLVVAHRFRSFSSGGRFEPCHLVCRWGTLRRADHSSADRIFCGSFTARLEPSRLPVPTSSSAPR